MSRDEKLIIWGRKNSINVMKVLWCCEELGLPFDRIDVGGAFGGNNEPDYLAMNPNGRVPVIRDKGLVLWESNVVVRYLSATYGSPGLFPANSGERWPAEQWMDWQQTTLQPPASTLFWGLVRTPPEKRDPEALEAARLSCAELWRMVDAVLSNKPFIAGSTFTMGDIPLGAAAFRWYAFDVERPALPHLEKWYHGLCERAGYRKHIMHPMT